LKQRGGRAPASRPRFTPSWLRTQLLALAGPLRAARFCIAYSGGLDSTALLSAMASLRERSGFALRALHVDHGLHTDSAQWARAARALARRAGVACTVLRVRIARGSGESIEALAREARYAALTAALANDEQLITAHTQDDQLETVLLALSRGGGLRGLAAMGARSNLAGRVLLRPLLPVSRAQLLEFAQARKLGWTEDLTNLDERFDRNYLRRKVLPALRERWPALAATASRSAAHVAEAQQQLTRLARRAAAQAADGATLRVSALRALDRQARLNLLLYWIAARGLAPPDHRRLSEIAGPLLEARPDATPRVQWRGGELRRHGDRLFALRAQESAAAPGTALAAQNWDWRRHPWVELGDGSALGVVADAQGDLDLAKLPARLRVDFRRGGERLQASHGRIPLKDLLQQHDIAPWQRSAVPLLLRGSRIVAVADLWLAEAFRAREGSAGPRGRLRWRHRFD
jgi:tRNA(Ile)-lysidine synthase